MKNCNKCGKENRDKAVFCRYCGDRLPEIAAKEQKETPLNITKSPRKKNDRKNDELDYVVGLEAAKEKVREHVATIKALVKLRGKSILKTVNNNVLITGPSGAGVSTLYYAIGEYFNEQKLYDPEKSDVFNPMTIDQLNLAENPLELIQVDDAHMMLPENIDDDLIDSPLEYVFRLASDARKLKDEKLGIIIAGNRKLQEYVDAHPDLKNLFALNIELPDYTPAELADICDSLLSETYNMSLSEEAYAKLCRVFSYERRNS